MSSPEQDAAAQGRDQKEKSRRRDGGAQQASAIDGSHSQAAAPKQQGRAALHLRNMTIEKEAPPTLDTNKELLNRLQTSQHSLSRPGSGEHTKANKQPKKHNQAKAEQRGPRGGHAADDLSMSRDSRTPQNFKTFEENRLVLPEILSNSGEGQPFEANDHHRAQQIRSN